MHAFGRRQTLFPRPRLYPKLMYLDMPAADGRRQTAEHAGAEREHCLHARGGAHGRQHRLEPPFDAAEQRFVLDLLIMRLMRLPNHSAIPGPLVYRVSATPEACAIGEVAVDFKIVPA